MADSRIPVPSVPTALVDVELVAKARRAVPTVVLTVPVTSPGEGSANAAERVRLVDGTPFPEEWLPAGVLRGQAGEVHQLRGGATVPRWIVGVGDAAEPRSWRAAGAALVRAVNADLAAAKDTGARLRRSVQLELADDVPDGCLAGFVLGLRLGGYTFTVSSDAPRTTLTSVLLISSSQVAAGREATLRDAAELASASALARDLANTPSNVKDPVWLAETAERLVGQVPGLTARVRDEEWLAARGFGGMLAVGGGSASPPRLIELRYRPRGASTHLLLVGKGITFDTGGISIKPADGMHLMRTDMSGGGAVIAAMLAIARRKLRVRVTALVPAAENHVSGTAYRPGDVIRHYGGRTTEVGNTDAEGRVVLADALAYGTAQFAPDIVVDVATLTGAMKVALGLRTGGLFATDDELARRLRDAGERVGESWWRMPLLEAHADAVTGRLADGSQTPEGPGAITAALYLREFAAGLPWAHLDIAGPARADKPYDEVTPGGTGFAARTLVEFAASYS